MSHFILVTCISIGPLVSFCEGNLRYLVGGVSRKELSLISCPLCLSLLSSFYAVDFKLMSGRGRRGGCSRTLSAILHHSVWWACNPQSSCSGEETLVCTQHSAQRGYITFPLHSFSAFWCLPCFMLSLLLHTCICRGGTICGGIVVVALWYCCGGDVVVLSWWQCDHVGDVVVTLLWWRCVSVVVLSGFGVP